MVSVNSVEMFQDCPLILEEWFQKENSFRLMFLDEEGGGVLPLSDFHQGGQWRVQEPVRCSVQVSAVYSVQHIVCHFRFERNPMFYIMVIFMPSFFLTIMSFSLFFLPLSGGEKVTTGLTIFLSLVVELLVVSDVLPATGENDLPIIAEVLIVLISLVFASCLVAVIVTSIYQKQTPPPKIVKQFLTCKFLTSTGLRSKYDQEVSFAMERDEEVDNSNVDKIEELFRDLQSKVEDFSSSWKLLAEVIDRCCLGLYCVFTSLVALFYVYRIRQAFE